MKEDQLHCDCEEHQGEPQRVQVYGNGWDKETAWIFNYCQAAIDLDRSRGFTVEVIQKDESK